MENSQKFRHLVVTLVILLTSGFTPAVATAQDLLSELQTADRVLSAGSIPVAQGGSAQILVTGPASDGIRGIVHFVNGSGRVVAQDTLATGGGGIFNNLMLNSHAYEVSYTTNGELIVVDNKDPERLELYRGVEPNGIIAVLISYIRTGGGDDSIRLACGTVTLQYPDSSSPTFIKMDTLNGV